MNDWTTSVHEGYRTKVIKVGGCTIEINRPILSQEEQKKRESAVVDTLAQIGKFAS